MTKKPVLSHSTEQILKPRETQNSAQLKNLSMTSPDSSTGFLVRNLLDKKDDRSPSEPTEPTISPRPVKKENESSTNFQSNPSPFGHTSLLQPNLHGLLNLNGSGLNSVNPAMTTPASNLLGTGYCNPLTFAYTRQFYQNLITHQALQALSSGRTPFSGSYDQKSVKVSKNS